MLFIKEPKVCLKCLVFKVYYLLEIDIDIYVYIYIYMSVKVPERGLVSAPVVSSSAILSRIDFIFFPSPSYFRRIILFILFKVSKHFSESLHFCRAAVTCALFPHQ